MSKLLHLTALLLGALIMAGCSNNGEGNWHLIDADEGWRYGDTLTFDAPAGDIDSLHICIYHNDAYRYANLWVELSYDTPVDSITVSADNDTTHNVGNMTAVDTFNIVLADPDGRWLGRGNGLSYMLNTAVRPGRYITPGSKLRLRHIMRTDSLTNIEKIGIIQ